MKKLYKFDIILRERAIPYFDYFCNKYKKRCKAIYKNKIYKLDKLHSLYFFENNNIKFTIITFVDLEHFKNEIENCTLFDIQEKKKHIKINSDILPKNLIFNIFKMEYKINEGENIIKIFGKIFVQNNIDKCIMVYRNKILPLQEFIKIEKCEKEKFEILLIGFAEISKEGFIFSKYNILKDKKENKKENISTNEKPRKQKTENKETENKESNIIFSELESENNNYINKDFIYEIQVKHYKNKLNSESNLTNEINDILLTLEKNIIISIGQTNTDKNYNSLFIENSNSILSITKDIKECDLILNNKYDSKFNDITLTHLFNGYTLLYSLLDKNKVCTNKIKDMSFMFYDCNSLLSFTDLTKWNISKITGINSMFYNCSSLFIIVPLFYQLLIFLGLIQMI